VDLGLPNGSVSWRVLVRFDQWDWSPVQNLATQCGIATPKVGFLGSGRVFNPPAIQYPWLEGASTKHHAVSEIPFVEWLWRYEDGPLDWSKIINSAEQKDMLITAPHYLGELGNKEDKDNQHNAEFAERLAQDPGFQGPFRLKMGRFEPIEVLVFVKKSRLCH